MELLPLTNSAQLFPGQPTARQRKDEGAVAFRGQHEHSLDSAGPPHGAPQVPCRSRRGIRSRQRPGCLPLALPTKDFDAMEERYVAPQPVQIRAQPSPDDQRQRRRGPSDAAASAFRQPQGAGRNEGACTVVGAGDYIEIWNEGTWAKLVSGPAQPVRRRGREPAGSTE